MKRTVCLIMGLFAAALTAELFFLSSAARAQDTYYINNRTTGKATLKRSAPSVYVPNAAGSADTTSSTAAEEAWLKKNRKDFAAPVNSTTHKVDCSSSDKNNLKKLDKKVRELHRQDSRDGDYDSFGSYVSSSKNMETMTDLYSRCAWAVAEEKE
jgi:hypothetical protein